MYRISLWTGRSTIHVVVTGCTDVAQAGAVAMDTLGWPWTFGVPVADPGAWVVIHGPGHD